MSPPRVFRHPLPVKPWHPWASVSPSERRNSRETGAGLGRLGLGPACVDRLPSSRKGRAHAQVPTPGPPARGWAEASPSPPQSGLDSGHHMPWPCCPQRCQVTSHLRTSAQSHTASGKTRIPSQLKTSPGVTASAEFQRIPKSSRAPGCQPAWRPAAHGPVAVASQANPVPTQRVIAHPPLACLHF